MREFRVLAAPLEGYSERAFRALCSKYGAHMTFTEMARCDALSRGNGSAWRKVQTDSKIPTAVQLLVPSASALKRFLERWDKSGLTADEWNLNLGCPSVDVINTGLGCAMMKRIGKINSLVDILKQTGKPVSLKIRLGLNEYEQRNKAYMNLLRDTEADYYIVHARNGRQKSSDPADWSVFSECLSTKRKIIANGDIRTVGDIQKMMDMGLHGAMLGRVSVQNPLLFSEIVKYLESKATATTSKSTTNLSDKQTTAHTTAIKTVKKDYMDYIRQYYGADQVQDPYVLKYTNSFLKHFGNVDKYKDLNFDGG